MAAVELMTMTAYAISRGLDKSTISKQVSAGLIPVVRIPGKKWVKIDPDAADEARARNLDGAKSRSALENLEIPPRREKVDTADAMPAVSTDDLLAKPTGNLAYTEARATSVALDAQKKQIELMKLRGDLVAKKKVEDGAQKAARLVRDRLLSVSDEIAETVFGADSVNSVRLALRSSLKKALIELADLLQQADYAPTAAEP